MTEITLRRYAKGQAIIAKGGAATDLYIVVRGRVGISRGAEPRDLPPDAVLEPGSFFGEAALLPGMRYWAYAHAITDALCVIVPQGKIAELGDALM